MLAWDFQLSVTVKEFLEPNLSKRKDLLWCIGQLLLGLFSLRHVNGYLGFLLDICSRYCSSMFENSVISEEDGPVSEPEALPILGQETGGSSSSKLRSYFPETWLWTLFFLTE